MSYICIHLVIRMRIRICSAYARAYTRYICLIFAFISLYVCVCVYVYVVRVCMPCVYVSVVRTCVPILGIHVVYLHSSRYTYAYTYL
jgi:hypothetical protein